MNIVEFQLSAVVIFNACIAVAGGPGGDRPDSTHPWAVHDENRPQARQVLAEEGAPPADAVVLFDGIFDALGFGRRAFSLYAAFRDDARDKSLFQFPIACRIDDSV